MINKMILMAAAAFTLMAGNAQARLGWTLDDCQAKWGAPIKVGTNAALGTTWCIFNTGSDLRVQVDLIDGRVQNVVYSSASKQFLTANAMQLLQINYAGDWQRYDDGRGKATIDTWKVVDQNGAYIAYAIFERSDNGDGRYTLQVATGYFNTYLRARAGNTNAWNLNV